MIQTTEVLDCIFTIIYLVRAIFMGVCLFVLFFVFATTKQSGNIMMPVIKGLNREKWWTPEGELLITWHNENWLFITRSKRKCNLVARAVAKSNLLKDVKGEPKVESESRFSAKAHIRQMPSSPISKACFLHYFPCIVQTCCTFLLLSLSYFRVA